jgi:hypothetical protein
LLNLSYDFKTSPPTRHARQPGLTPLNGHHVALLPQDANNRIKVADAKERYTSLYLDLAYKKFGIRFPTGGLRLSESTTREVTATITKGWQVGFTADPSFDDDEADDSSSTREVITRLPAQICADLRGDSFSAVMARLPVDAKRPEAVVGRVFTFDSNGERAFAQSLGGRLTLDGFDYCELMVSVSVAGRQARKTIYAT